MFGGLCLAQRSQHHDCRAGQFHPKVSTHSPLATSCELPQGQLIAQAVPRSVTLINSEQWRQRAVMGSLAWCCMSAIIVAFPSGGQAEPRPSANRCHSAWISSYVLSMNPHVIDRQTQVTKEYEFSKTDSNLTVSGHTWFCSRTPPLGQTSSKYSSRPLQS